MLQTLLKFDYRIELHYSQTSSHRESSRELFDYRIELHYSQTFLHIMWHHNEFDYRIELHYSQTSNFETTPLRAVQVLG